MYFLKIYFFGISVIMNVHISYIHDIIGVGIIMIGNIAPALPLFYLYKSLTENLKFK